MTCRDAPAHNCAAHQFQPAGDKTRSRDTRDIDDIPPTSRVDEANMPSASHPSPSSASPCPIHAVRALSSLPPAVSGHFLADDTCSTKPQSSNHAFTYPGVSLGFQVGSLSGRANGHGKAKLNFLKCAYCRRDKKKVGY